VWAQYKESGADYLRNQLVEEYLHLVKYHAQRIYAKLPSGVELDDLIGAGNFGLMEAIESFDLTRGVKFETFCVPRICGAILDELRLMDWVPRLVRSRAHKLEEACKSLEAELGRSACDDEIADHMGVDKNEYVKFKREATAVSLVSLSRKCSEADGQKDICEMDFIEDKRSKNPLHEIQKRDLKETLIKGLNREEKLIVVLYYFEELTMKEIGATLDLSESRVSQIHKSILARLKAQRNVLACDIVA